MLPPHISLLTRRRFLENSALVAACTLVPQKTEAQSSERPAMRNGATLPSGRTHSGPLLRYYVPPEAQEEHLAELITTCERTGITDVALFTTEYLGISQFKEIDELQKTCAHLAQCADRLPPNAAGELVVHRDEQLALKLIAHGRFALPAGQAVTIVLKHS